MIEDENNPSKRVFHKKELKVIDNDISLHEEIKVVIWASKDSISLTINDKEVSEPFPSENCDFLDLLELWFGHNDIEGIVTEFKFENIMGECDEKKRKNSKKIMKSDSLGFFMMECWQSNQRK